MQKSLLFKNVKTEMRTVFIFHVFQINMDALVRWQKHMPNFHYEEDSVTDVKMT